MCCVFIKEQCHEEDVIIGRRTRILQIVHTRRLSRTAEDQLTDNANFGDQVANTHANEIQEQRNERRRANALKQIQARQRPPTHTEHMNDNACKYIAH